MTDASAVEGSKKSIVTLTTKSKQTSKDGFIDICDPIASCVDSSQSSHFTNVNNTKEKSEIEDESIEVDKYLFKSIENNNFSMSETPSEVLENNLFQYELSTSSQDTNNLDIIDHMNDKEFATASSSQFINKRDVEPVCKISMESPKHQEGAIGKRLCSSKLALISNLFQITKLNGSSANQEHERNKEKLESRQTVSFQNNYVNDSFPCCPFAVSNVWSKADLSLKSDQIKSHVNNIKVVNVSPKSKSKVFSCFKLPIESQVLKESSHYNNRSLIHKTSSGIASQGQGRGIESQSQDSVMSISKQILYSDFAKEDFTKSNKISDIRCHLAAKNIPSLISLQKIPSQTKFRLIHEGDISLCFLDHSKTVIKKVLTSKFLRCWETHHIYLKEDSVCLKTPTGMFEAPVSYSNLMQINTIGQWDGSDQFYVCLVFIEGSVILQTSSSFIRDQWLSSILWKKNMHKYRNILQNSTRPEVILREIKTLIFLTLDSPLLDECIINVPLDIISKAFSENEVWMNRELREEVITAVAPLLEKTRPSLEIFHFFTQHCLLHPRSQVIIDVFTSIVQRILKRTFDFGKSPSIRKFASEYMIALYSQNDGNEAIKKFISSVHGPNFECPHPRVLQNLVAVHLAAIFSHFEQRKVLLTESVSDENFSQTNQQLDKQLLCHVTALQTISEYEDWRPEFAQLLQPVPFPGDALSLKLFIEGFTPVIKKIGTDPRCEVHEMILGIREDKEGWLNIYCPSSAFCNDGGQLWCLMLQTLLSCCCRRKGFLQKMVKNLGTLMLLALRDHDVAREILCLTLEWNLVNNVDQELQIITTLESTEKGRIKYKELCRRQEYLRQLQTKRGPRKVTLPIRSTDIDVAQLLSRGSFGNLECLSLAFTNVTSSCASHLIQLPSLRYLNLWATHFGDSGLLIIAEHLDKLQVLNLCETPVTDKGISALINMKNLQKLNLNSTKLSAQMMEVLKKKLPLLQELDVRYTDAW